MNGPFAASVAAILTLAGASQAQIYVPALSTPLINELNSRSNYPLMRAASRCQFVVSQSELGAPATLTKLAFRYDGGTFGATGGTLANLDVYLGAAATTPGASSATFATNVQGSLTQVAAITNRVFESGELAGIPATRTKSKLSDPSTGNPAIDTLVLRNTAGAAGSFGTSCPGGFTPVSCCSG